MKKLTKMEEITNQLLEKIYNLQEQLTEKKQKTKEIWNKLEQLSDAYKELKIKRKDDKKYSFLGGIIFTIFFYLLIKIFLWCFF